MQVPSPFPVPLAEAGYSFDLPGSPVCVEQRTSECYRHTEGICSIKSPFKTGFMTVLEQLTKFVATQGQFEKAPLCEFCKEVEYEYLSCDSTPLKLNPRAKAPSTHSKLHYGISNSRRDFKNKPKRLSIARRIR